eukprot:3103273-Prymnesium_polylepis.2
MTPVSPCQGRAVRESERARAAFGVCACAHACVRACLMCSADVRPSTGTSWRVAVTWRSPPRNAEAGRRATAAPEVRTAPLRG